MPRKYDGRPVDKDRGMNEDLLRVHHSPDGLRILKVLKDASLLFKANPIRLTVSFENLMDFLMAVRLATQAFESEDSEACIQIFDETLGGAREIAFIYPVTYQSAHYWLHFAGDGVLCALRADPSLFTHLEIFPQAHENHCLGYAYLDAIAPLNRVILNQILQSLPPEISDGGGTLREEDSQ
jgi:hypothetical protein